jgi:hypothetical protein
MKSLIVIAFLAFIPNSYSQSDKDPEYVHVNWIVGTEKTVYQTDSTVIYQVDSIFMASGTSSNYKIKIVSKKDTVYEVLFKQINIGKDFKIESELVNTTSIEEMMQTVITELQQKFIDFEYSFLVDKNTGQAFDVKNQEELGKTIEEMVTTVLDKYAASSKMNLDEKKKNAIRTKVSEMIGEKMPAVMNTMMNSFNYIFQAYSFPYSLNETLIMETVVYDIDEVKHGDTESPANIVINSSLKNSKLKINYKYDYDKESAYQQHIVSRGNEKKIPIDQFEIDEHVDANFDMKSSWITESTSSVNVKMGDVTVNKISRVIIK